MMALAFLTFLFLLRPSLLLQISISFFAAWAVAYRFLWCGFVFVVEQILIKDDDTIARPGCSHIGFCGAGACLLSENTHKRRRQGRAVYRPFVEFECRFPCCCVCILEIRLVKDD